MNAQQHPQSPATPNTLASKQDPQRVRDEVEALLAQPVEDAEAEAALLAKAHDVLQQALH
ncbi:hypothetical protein [Corynebacterium pelargi]|uniref:Uncharacterized protein n=1 Tax=Corynebacterium pelargi TaxID=1471400 RepID=A0A410W930_9CORY|nr:hypothetical protein [Corynebacterium pelargi]QAU52463.1 hypothetical protein CPELA_05965 [Corynebacterium pelargi]GGG67486.1 hypothetical protein GCM10007338_00040 [Corynebacterium pelargi]